jgi:hypothetical protein
MDLLVRRLIHTYDKSGADDAFTFFWAAGTLVRTH